MQSTSLPFVWLSIFINHLFGFRSLSFVWLLIFINHLFGFWSYRLFGFRSLSCLAFNLYHLFGFRSLSFVGLSIFIICWAFDLYHLFGFRCYNKTLCAMCSGRFFLRAKLGEWINTQHTWGEHQHHINTERERESQNHRITERKCMMMTTQWTSSW